MGRPRKRGKREPNGRISRISERPLRRLDGFLDEPTAIYVMDAAPLVKIGISKSIKQRLGEIQTGNGQVVRLYWYGWMDGFAARQVELAIHQENRGTTRHAHGEWYYLPAPEAVALVLKKISQSGHGAIHKPEDRREVEGYPEKRGF